jgi:hypothetical protein
MAKMTVLSDDVYRPVGKRHSEDERYTQTYDKCRFTVRFTETEEVPIDRRSLIFIEIEQTQRVCTYRDDQ